MSRALIWLMTLILFVPASGMAQEAGKKGFTIAYPSSIGFIWHVTDKVAVRPDFTFATSSTESSSTNSDSLGTSVGVSALFYLKKWDSASAYVAPRFAWSRIHTEAESTPFPAFPELPDRPVPFENETTSHNYLYAGSIGVQAWIGRRFSIFGEAGLQYTRSTFDVPSISFSSPESRTLSLRSGIGGVLYF